MVTHARCLTARLVCAILLPVCMATAGMVDPLSLSVTGDQYGEFAEALIDAFPSYAELERMVRFRLDLQLSRIAGENTGLETVAYKLIERQKANGHFLRLLDAARKSRPGNPKLAFFAEQFALAISTPAGARLEEVIRNTNSFLDIAKWRQALGGIESRICRIDVPTNADTVYGTGFLVGPDLVLTNWHVVEAVIADESNQYTPAGKRAKKRDVALRFDYMEIAGGVKNAGVEQRLAEIVDYSPYDPLDMQALPKAGLPDPDRLDHALLRLETPDRRKPFAARPIGDNAEPGATERGTIAIPLADWPFDLNSALFIVQHPSADTMKLALDTDAVLELNDNRTRVTYKTNTLPGSSGSPCFNQHLELVALHHAGDPTYGPLYRPKFNQGIPISAIRDLLRRRNKLTGVTLG
jgi:hypothetical protein